MRVIVAEVPSRYAFDIICDRVGLGNVVGRFAACSGGWDWAPYVSQDQGRAFTRGPWKSVYVAENGSGVFVMDLVPRVGPQPGGAGSPSL